MGQRAAFPYRGVQYVAILSSLKNHHVQLHNNVVIILKPLISNKRLITDKETLSMSETERKKCKWSSREGGLLT